MNADTTRETCGICGLPDVEHTLIPRNRSMRVDCTRCGTHLLTTEARRALRSGRSMLPILDRLYLLSAIIRQHAEKNGTPFCVESSMLSNEGLDEALSEAVAKDASDRTKKFLAHLARKSAHRGARIELSSKLDYPLAFCKNDEEFVFHLRQWSDKGLIELTEDGSRLRLALTPAGWEMVQSSHEVKGFREGRK